jgi:hypothetical protein
MGAKLPKGQRRQYTAKTQSRANEQSFRLPDDDPEPVRPEVEFLAFAFGVA